MKSKKKFKKTGSDQEEYPNHRLHRPQKQKEKYKGPKYWLREDEVEDFDLFAEYRNEEE